MGVYKQCLRKTEHVRVGVLRRMTEPIHILTWTRTQETMVYSTVQMTGLVNPNNCIF